MSWSELPTNLRTVLGAALLLVIGVAVASFTLSFIALREVASALLASEVVLVGVSMIKGVNRAVPFVFMVLFGALTVWFNVARVPADWRLVTAVPPVAGIFMTLLIAFLVKVLALAWVSRCSTTPPLRRPATSPLRRPRSCSSRTAPTAWREVRFRATARGRFLRRVRLGRSPAHLNKEIPKTDMAS
jgi:hypothetical protein